MKFRNEKIRVVHAGSSEPAPITTEKPVTVQEISDTIPGLSPYRLLPLLVASIFFSEILVMLILNRMPGLSVFTEAFIDALMLLVILSPTFYFFHYRPLLTHQKLRKQIMHRLARSEERLNLALEAVNDGLWDWNIMKKEIYFSPRWSQMLGYEPGEIPSDANIWPKLIHPDDYHRVQAQMNTHLSGTSNHFEAEFRMKTATGEWKWVLVRGKVVSWDENGEPLRAVGTQTDIHARKRAEDALRQKKEDIRHLSQQLINNSETEKKKLAQELHDEFGQLLTAFKLGVDMIQNHHVEDEADIEYICARLIGTIEYMELALDNICDDLRPVMLDDLGLAATLNWLRQNVGNQSALDLRIDTSQLTFRLPPEIELTCYRICQEAINNCLKHSAATEIQITFRVEADRVLIAIEDNGCGFSMKELSDTEKNRWGIGLLGMKERVTAVKGQLKIDSAEGKGTKIGLVIPLTTGRREDVWQQSVLQ